MKNLITLFGEHSLTYLAEEKTIILEQEIKNVINAFLVAQNDLSLMDVNLEWNEGTILILKLVNIFID